MWWKTWSASASSLHRVPERRTYERKNTERKQYLRPLVVKYWPPVEGGATQHWLRRRCWAIATSLKSIKKNHSNKHKQKWGLWGASSKHVEHLLHRSFITQVSQGLARSHIVSYNSSQYTVDACVINRLRAGKQGQVFIKLLPVGGFITIKLEQES